METAKTQGKWWWDLSKLAMPPFKVIYAISDVGFWCRLVCELTRAHGPQKVFFLISMLHGVVCGNICFTHCLHILFLNVFIDSPLESVPVRLPVRWLSLPAAVVWWSFFETSCNKLLSLLTSVSIDSPCELALFWLPVCWLQLRTVKLLPGEVLHRYQPGKIMKEILAMP